MKFQIIIPFLRWLEWYFKSAQKYEVFVDICLVFILFVINFSYKESLLPKKGFENSERVDIGETITYTKRNEYTGKKEVYVTKRANPGIASIVIILLVKFMLPSRLVDEYFIQMLVIMGIRSFWI